MSFKFSVNKLSLDPNELSLGAQKTLHNTMELPQPYNDRRKLMNYFVEFIYKNHELWNHPITQQYIQDVNEFIIHECIDFCLQIKKKRPPPVVASGDICEAYHEIKTNFEQPIIISTLDGSTVYLENWMEHPNIKWGIVEGMKAFYPNLTMNDVDITFSAIDIDTGTINDVNLNNDVRDEFIQNMLVWKPTCMMVFREKNENSEIIKENRQKLPENYTIASVEEPQYADISEEVLEFYKNEKVIEIFQNIYNFYEKISNNFISSFNENIQNPIYKISFECQLEKSFEIISHIKYYNAYDSLLINRKDMLNVLLRKDLADISRKNLTDNSQEFYYECYYIDYRIWNDAVMQNTIKQIVADKINETDNEEVKPSDFDLTTPSCMDESKLVMLDRDGPDIFMTSLMSMSILKGPEVKIHWKNKC